MEGTRSSLSGWLLGGCGSSHIRRPRGGTWPGWPARHGLGAPSVPGLSGCVREVPLRVPWPSPTRPDVADGLDRRSGLECSSHILVGGPSALHHRAVVRKWRPVTLASTTTVVVTHKRSCPPWNVRRRSWPHRACWRLARLHHDHTRPSSGERAGSGSAHTSSRCPSGTAGQAGGPPLVAPRPGGGSRPARHRPASMR